MYRKMYIMLQKNLKAITWSTAERVRFHRYERSLKHLKQSPQWPSIYIIQKEAYFPIREINLSQQKKSVRWHRLWTSVSYFQYCLFTFGTIFQRGMYELKS